MRIIFPVRDEDEDDEVTSFAEIREILIVLVIEARVGEELVGPSLRNTILFFKFFFFLINFNGENH